MKSLFKSLIAISAFVCLFAIANFADARVCFLVGGRCNDNTFIGGQTTESQTCSELGYEITQCTNPKIPDPDYTPCSQAGQTFYYGCVCPSQYQYEKETGASDPYQYGNKCDDKYDRKACKAEYQYVEKPSNSSEEEERLDSYLDIIQDYGLNGPVSYCANNSQPVTTDGCTEVAGSSPISRYKTCTCNTGTYKYKMDPAKGYDAAIFNASDNDSNKCEGSDGVEYYKTAECSGALVGDYFYRNQCASDEVSVPGNNNSNIKTWRAENGSSTVCYACEKRCSGLSESSCRTELANAANRGKHCKKTDDDCYFLESGGVCPCGVIANDITTTNPGNLFTFDTVTNAGGTCYWNIEQTCNYASAQNCESANRGFTCTAASDGCYYPASCKSPYSDTQSAICKSFDNNVDFERIITATAENYTGSTIRCYKKEKIPCDQLQRNGSLVYPGYYDGYVSIFSNPIELHYTPSLTGSSGCASRICRNPNDRIVASHGDSISCSKSGSPTLTGTYYIVDSTHPASASGVIAIPDGYICRKPATNYSATLSGTGFFIKQ